MRCPLYRYKLLTPEALPLEVFLKIREVVEQSGVDWCSIGFAGVEETFDDGEDA